MASTISRQAVARARAFVEKTARPLDRAYLAYAAPAGSGERSADQVLSELAKFQTPDGGFAHGIEPDVRGPAPSAIATSIAFQYMRGIGASAQAPVVKSGIEYLVRTIDAETAVWPAIDERVKEGPHAPWWTPGLPRFRGYALNPSAELLGYLYDFRVDVPETVLEAATSTVLNAVEQAGVIESPYELYCCMRLAQTTALPARVRDILESLLVPSLMAVDPDDPHLNLLRLTPTPTSFGYAFVRDGLGRQAERLIASQAEDGGWRPAWEAWHSEAHEEWSGVLTSQAIISLTAHGYAQ